MSACKTLARAAIYAPRRKISTKLHPNLCTSTLQSLAPPLRRSPFHLLGLRFHGNRPPSRLYSADPAINLSDEPAAADTVEELLAEEDRVHQLTKMERRTAADEGGGRWFPYLNTFKAGPASLESGEVIDALDPYIMEARKGRLRRAVENRSYSVCLVVEGLSDFGNVSAAFRSADALGIQSVHVVSRDSRKRYRDNRHVSKGAEKWLDIELWKSPMECFTALKARGYRIATTHLGTDSVSVYDLDWSSPTAIVVGNEHFHNSRSGGWESGKTFWIGIYSPHARSLHIFTWSPNLGTFRMCIQWEKIGNRVELAEPLSVAPGISDEALQLSDVHCSIPMNGMVDSFNVSVAAGILMHHVVCDRVSRLGRHGDLTSEERQILLAEFYLRHRESTLSIVHEYAKRKVDMHTTKL